MDPRTSAACTAFLDGSRVASGAPTSVLGRLGELSAVERASALVLDDASGRTLELWSGDAPPAPSPAPTRGRPRLGVAPKEVTLLPRHWEWLARQPGGASPTLRKLVEAASRDPAAERREARDGLYRAMNTLAGNRAGFEDASRALFAGNAEAFRTTVLGWPEGIASYLRERSSAVFETA